MFFKMYALLLSVLIEKKMCIENLFYLKEERIFTHFINKIISGYFSMGATVNIYYIFYLLKYISE